MQHKPQWQTLRWLRVFCLTLLVSFTGIGANAQCNNTSSYGSATAPAVINGTVNFSTCSYYGEYSTLFSVQAASLYQCTLLPSGFITIRQGTPSGPVVGFGTSPLTWTSTVAGTYYCHWNSSSACGTDFSCHTTSVKYLGSATGCSGTPTAGTATANGVSGSTGGCPTQALALAVTGATVATGLTYQWEFSATGTPGSYAAISGATTATYTIPSFGAGNVGYYDRITACGANAAASAPVSVTMNTFLNCYCIPTTTNGCTAGDHITNVTFSSLGSPINNTTGACLSASYSNYTSTVGTAQVTQGDMVAVSVTVNNGGTEYAGGWIDYNQSGTYDAGEFIALTDADGVAPWVYTGTANIPLTATVGITGMRFRSSYNAPVTSGSACSVYSYGETEDYRVNIALTTACSGTPNPGNALANGVAGTYAACLGSNVVLSLANPTMGTAVTYQWSNNSGPIAGATNSTYTISGFTAADDYLCLVTCTAPGGGSAYSNIVSLSVNSFLNCYCTANSQYGTSGLFYGVITNVTFNALNNTSSAPGGSPYYTNYAPLGTSVNQGLPYNLSVTLPQYGQAAVWFDWNQNGVFENTPAEFIFMGNNTTNVSATYTQTINVPATATPGLTRMRVRSEAYFYANLVGTQACGNTVYGETEDYELNVIVPTACSGTPAPGNTLASVTSVCPGGTVNLSLSNTNNGTGISYQWVSNSGGPIAGATNAFYTATVNAADDYWCQLTCANSGLVGSSNPVSIALNSFISCYCTSGATTTFDEEIYSVTVNGASTNPAYAGAAGCTTPAPGPGSLLSRYSNFKTLGSLTTITQGASTPFTVEENECDGATYYAFGTAIWIDLNQNGSYADAGEQVFVEATTAVGPRNVTGTFTIPYTANLGITTMRVMVAEGLSGAGLTPCATFGYGETEDFQVEIIANASCTGVVAPGNTIASATSACPGTSVTLSIQNPTPGNGVTYQWFSNLGGTIAGATNATYSPVITAQDDFWCQVSCQGTGTQSSNPVTITVNGFMNCYCATGLGGSCGINAISSVAITGTSLNNVTNGCTGPYSQYPATGSTTATLVPGSTYVTTIGTIVGSNSQAAVWIDYNHSGVFEASEYTLINAAIPSGGSASGNLTIPVTALSGQTGMRVRTDWVGAAAWTPSDACTNRTWGETEDYVIDIAVLVGCSGTPNPGNTISSVSSVCPGGSVTLTLANAATLGSGVTFQWENNAGPIAGATNSFFTTSLSAADDFTCNVTCTASGLSAYSGLVSVALTPFYSCYCIPTNAGSACITNVTFGSLSNTTAGCPGGTNYNAFPTPNPIIFQGLPQTLSVTCDGAAITSVWIDYNHNGSYEASEWNQVYTNALTGSISITVPGTALTGLTGMRVRSRLAGNINGAGDACLAMGSGETEDFVVDIQIPVGCSGTPTPGNSVASASSVCPNQTVSLSLSGQASLGSGNTYQWYNNAGAIAGATNSSYVATITAADAFYCVVTCTNSSQTATSVAVSVGLNSFATCYCASAATTTADEEIYSVTVNGASTPAAYAGANGCTTVAPGAGSILSRYSNFTSLGTFTTMQEGNTISFTVEENECDGATYYAFGTAIFIDYNHNGSYADAGEQVFAETATAVGPRNVVGTFTIPYGVTLGQTGMRIIVAEGYAGAGLTPCLSYGYGETEDFIVDIIATVPCSGTPTPGNTVASAASVCPNQTVNLSLSGQATLGSGNTYQWYNNAGAIAGATNASYVATITAADNFYCDVTCTGSGLTGTSASVAVGVNSFISCYCSTGLGGICGTQSINSVAIVGTTLNNVTGGCVTPYSQFPATGSTTATLNIGAPYDFTVGTGNNGNPAQIGLWIDYDHSGTFDVSEFTLISSSSPSAGSSTLTVNIPATALGGQTGMRVRTDWELTAIFTGLDACTNRVYGETEDYILNLVVPVPCSGTPAPGNTLASATAVCPGTTVNFTLQNPSFASGISYQWFNNGGAIAGATNAFYSQVMTSADAFYCDVTCSGQTGTSVAVSITINSPSACYCAAGATTIGCTTGDEYVGNVTLNTINNTSTCPVSGQYSDFTTISTNLLQGATYTASVLIPNWFGGDQASVWIDFNQDGILDDVTEQFPLTIGGGSGTVALEGPVTVPATALTGATRMRVRGNYVGTMSSCGITTYGEVEDYTVVIDPVATATTLNLNAFVQAYWDGNSAMNPALFNQGQANPITDCDSITVELRTASSPTTIAYSNMAVLHTDGTAACVFPSGVSSGYYYIAVKGRNMLETWSADSILISGPTAAYNFTTAAAQAYGGNQIELTTANIPNGIFAFYSGDIVKDAGEATDLLDLNQLEFEINNFSFGYFAEDLNGDGNVDILDSPSLEANISGFIYSVHP